MKPQQMHFCVLYSKGTMSAGACAEQAGYKKSNSGTTATRLLKMPEVVGMCAKLEEAHIARLGITSDTVMSSMLELYQRSLQAEAWTPAITALSKLGQWLGMENKLTTSVKVDVAFEDLLQRTIDITPPNVFLSSGTKTSQQNPENITEKNKIP